MQPFNQFVKGQFFNFFFPRNKILKIYNTIALVLDFFLESLEAPFDGDKVGSETVDCEADA